MSEIGIFGIVGNPVIHSKSPEMHNKAFKEIGENAVYVRIAGENAMQALETAKELKVKGLNVTAPFKEEFLELVDEIDESARRVGAVNTVLISKGKVSGFNTDCEGVLGALKEKGIELDGKTVVVIGSGGAAKAAVCALTSREKAEVTVINRGEDFEKAKELGKKFGCEVRLLERKVLEEVITKAEVIVSCVSTGERIIPKELLNEKSVVFEANYSEETTLAKDAKEKGCKFIDGREWLVFQGVKVFEMFTGKKAPEEVMRKAVYANTQRNDSKNNIALIGFMGTGKTSVAKEITKINGMELVNIDKEIEKNAKISIKETFERFEEKKFREMETNELRKIEELKNKVIDCGGGIILKEENRKVLKKNCVVVWLWANAESILERTKGKERPLLNVSEKKEKIKALLLERMQKYAKSTDLVVGSEEKPEEIAKLIVYENNKTRN